MGDKDRIRILIADDHPVVRSGLVSVIERREDMEVVGEASNGEQAIAMFRQFRPDLTLMDLRMPVKDGIQAMTTIRQDYPNAKFIVLTTYDGDEDIYRGLRAGAKGYLLKDAPRDTLLEAIRTVHGGHTSIPPEIASKLAERMAFSELTERELEVLRQIVSGKSNQEIGNDLFITEGTVKAHVNSILNKLGVSDRTQAATKALKRGLVHLEDN